MDQANLTPTERRMIDVLRDGKPHTIQELHGCLHDELGPLSNVSAHLSGVRSKLRPFKRGVLAEVVGKTVYYRLVAYVVEQ